MSLGEDEIDQLRCAVGLDAVGAGEPAEPGDAVEVSRVVAPCLYGTQWRPFLGGDRDVAQRTSGRRHVEVDERDHPVVAEHDVFREQIVVADDRSSERMAQSLAQPEIPGDVERCGRLVESAQEAGQVDEGIVRHRPGRIRRQRHLAVNVGRTSRPSVSLPR